MKFYNNKFGRRLIDRRADFKVPDRDALLYSVDEDAKTCIIKIQGSTTQITAHYPRNWFKLPYWMKPGNAVRVRHRQGNRGYIEVIGNGRALPTGVGAPNIPYSPDDILSGMEINATSPVSLCVTVSSGTYRIDGVTYYYMYGIDDILMGGDSPMTMGTANVYMGDNPATVVCLGSPPAAGYTRYDILQIAADGVIDVVEGTAAAIPTEPTMPATSLDHVKIGHIFRPGSESSDGIEQWQINAYYNLSKPTYVTIDWNDDFMNDDQVVIPYVPGGGLVGYSGTLYVWDQYDKLYTRDYVRFLLELPLENGNSYIVSNANFSGRTIEGFAWITYYHDHGAFSAPPIIKVTLPDWNVVYYWSALVAES